MKNKMYIQVTLTFTKDKKTKQWLGLCEELGTANFGDNIEEVAKELTELIKLHIDTLEKVGELDNFFRKNNVVYFKSEPPKKVEVIPSDSKTETFYKPFTYQIACV